MGLKTCLFKLFYNIYIISLDQFVTEKSDFKNNEKYLTEMLCKKCDILDHFLW